MELLSATAIEKSAAWKLLQLIKVCGEKKILRESFYNKESNKFLKISDCEQPDIAAAVRLPHNVVG